MVQTSGSVQGGVLEGRPRTGRPQADAPGTDDRLFVVMPAYNEAADILDTLSQWYPVVEEVGDGARLVVTDDGSIDDTLEKLRSFAKAHPRLVVRTKENSGHGPTVVGSYAFALEQGADYVFQTDSDGQTDPADFWQIWEARRDYDAQFGNRAHRGDGEQRVFVERTLRRVVRHCFGVEAPDTNAPFRLMQAGFLRKCVDFLPADCDLPNVMLVVLAEVWQVPHRYVEVSFKPRSEGKSTVNKKFVLREGVKALRDFKGFARRLGL